MPTAERDEVTGITTTGREWDGIKELNTPLPRWWLWTFYATIVWAIVYSAAYPAWPLIDGATKGFLGYSSRAEVASDIGRAQAAQSQWLSKIKSASLEQIAQDPELLQFARAGGAAAFKVNCVQCHGSGAAGGKGYPNLNDDDWLWGGSLDQIHTTLVNGARDAINAGTRTSLMPSFGGGVLEAKQIAVVAEHVLALSGQDHDAMAAAEGATVFAENCAACHGGKGEGNRDLGAPRLNDAVWLYGNERAAVLAQVTGPRHGVMPAWGGRLDETTIKQLAVFVHSLGGGERPQP